MPAMIFDLELSIYTLPQLNTYPSSNCGRCLGFKFGNFALECLTRNDRDCVNVSDIRPPNK